MALTKSLLSEMPVDKQYSGKLEGEEKPTVLKYLLLMKSEFSGWEF